MPFTYGGAQRGAGEAVMAMLDGAVGVRGRGSGYEGIPLAQRLGWLTRWFGLPAVERFGGAVPSSSGKTKDKARVSGCLV
jgi:hypothetical protein